MAKAAGKKGSEQDKDLLALVELQDKLNMNAGLVQMVSQQLQRASVTGRKTQLTLEELSAVPSSVPTYKQVGKAYLLEPLPQVLEELQEELKASQETVKRLTQQREHATKALAATESELRELFKTRPELGRQLAAAGAS